MIAPSRPPSTLDRANEAARRRLETYRARVRGCLLGGAVGDALGAPVEFLSWAQILAEYGPHGVTGLRMGTRYPG